VPPFLQTSVSSPPRLLARSPSRGRNRHGQACQGHDHIRRALICLAHASLRPAASTFSATNRSTIASQGRCPSFRASTSRSSSTQPLGQRPSALPREIASTLEPPSVAGPAATAARADDSGVFFLNFARYSTSVYSRFHLFKTVHFLFPRRLYYSSFSHNFQTLTSINHLINRFDYCV
jgi:hypothetical protein